MFFLSNFGNFFQFLFQIFSARFFLPEDISLFGSINSLYILISAPIFIIPLLVARLFESDIKFNHILNYLCKLLSLFILFLFFVALLFNGHIKELLNISDQIYLNYGYATIILSFAIASCFGILQGLKKFTYFGILHFFSLSSKFVLLLIFYQYDQKVDLLFISTILGIILNIFIFIFFMRKDITTEFFERYDFKNLSKIFFDFSYIYLITSVILVFITNIDVFLSRVFLDEYNSGLYIVGSSFSKIPLFLTLTLVYVLFPELKKGEKNSIILLISLSFVFFSSLIISMIFLFYGEIILGFIYGDKYLSLNHSVLILIPAFSLLNMSNMLMMQFIKNNYFEHIFGFVLLTIIFGIISFVFLNNITQLSFFVLIYTLFFFLFNILIYLTKNYKS